jgi:hypothetical protein
MVINNDPTYAYLLEGNALVDQKLVMAHVYGHADFFVNNVYFAHTNRKMIDTMAHHATRVRCHQESRGVETVERFMDACLSVEELIDPGAVFREARRVGKPVEEPEQQDPGRLPAKAYLDRYVNPPDYLAEKRRQVKQAREDAKRFRRRIDALTLDGAARSWEQDALKRSSGTRATTSSPAKTKAERGGPALAHPYLIIIPDDTELIDRATTIREPSPSRRAAEPRKLGLLPFRDINAANMGHLARSGRPAMHVERLRWTARWVGLRQDRPGAALRRRSSMSSSPRTSSERQGLFRLKKNARIRKHELKASPSKTSSRRFSTTNAPPRHHRPGRKLRQFGASCCSSTLRRRGPPHRLGLEVSRTSRAFEAPRRIETQIGNSLVRLGHDGDKSIQEDLDHAALK